jgi:hypothetical protein
LDGGKQVRKSWARVSQIGEKFSMLGAGKCATRVVVGWKKAEMIIF